LLDNSDTGLGQDKAYLDLVNVSRRRDLVDEIRFLIPFERSGEIGVRSDPLGAGWHRTSTRADVVSNPVIFRWLLARPRVSVVHHKIQGRRLAIPPIYTPREPHIAPGRVVPFGRDANVDLDLSCFIFRDIPLPRQ